MDGDQRGQVAIVLPMGENPESLLYEVEEHQNLLVVEFTTLLAQNSISGTKRHMVWQALHVTLPGVDSRGAIHTLHHLYSETSWGHCRILELNLSNFVWVRLFGLLVCQPTCVSPGKCPRGTAISCLPPQLHLSGLSGLPHLSPSHPKRRDSKCSYYSSFSQKGPHPRFPRVGVTLHYPLFCPHWPQCPLRYCDQGCWH